VSNEAIEITLRNGEILPVFDGDVARFIASNGRFETVLEIPIPDDKYLQFRLLEKLRKLLRGDPESPIQPPPYRSEEEC